MTRLSTLTAQAVASVAPRAFHGLLSGFEAGPALSWGLLETVALRRSPSAEPGESDRLATPEESLKLVQAATYGTIVLRNTSPNERLIVPMHIGFFQPGVQNHATSRVLVIEAGETLSVNDCFCVQAAQGGLLQEAQQRFLVLPLGLRTAALAKRRVNGFSRLWGNIDSYTRQFGVATGGHLERLLRPNFARLQPLRHALEAAPEQLGAAYFIAGQLAGVEVTPHAAYWAELGPILAMYCYGPDALLAERRGAERIAEPLDLESLANLDDLAARLREARARELDRRCTAVQELADLSFDEEFDEDRHGLRVTTLCRGEWIGQVVRDGRQTVYASVFRNFTWQTEGDSAA